MIVNVTEIWEEAIRGCFKVLLQQSAWRIMYAQGSRDRQELPE
jgi:hypothetical protein